MGDQNFTTIGSDIGLFGGTALVVGNVIGISVFVLPVPLAAEAGPSVVLAVLAATIPLTFGILMSLQLGGALPVAGGNYVYGSRLIGPFWGFLLPWVAVPGVWAGLLFVGISFADFTTFITEQFAGIGLPHPLLVYAMLLPFLLVNLLGIRIVTWAQFSMVAIVIAGMAAYILPGVVHVEAANYTPWFPNGIAPFVAATVSIYFPLRGFSMVTELGEEIANPVENIPRVLALSAIVSVTLMVGVVIVTVGVVPWDSLSATTNAGVAVAAMAFLPDWAVALVATAAIMGGLSSINTTYAGFSRALMRAARDEAVPSKLAAVHSRWDTPHWAVLLMGVPPLFLAPLFASDALVPLSITLSMAILFGVFMGSIALWNLPTAYPQRYQHSIYQLPRPVLKLVSVGGALSAGLLLLGLATEEPWLVLGLACWIVLGYGAFRFRVRQLSGRNVDLPARMSELHGHE